MKTIKMMAVAATTAALLAASTAAYGQIGRIGGGSGLGGGNGLGAGLGAGANNGAKLGSRLGLNRNAAGVPADAETIMAPEAAAPTAAPAAAPAAATPGVTRPVAAAPTAAAAPAAATPAKAPVTKSDGSEFVIPADATAEQLVAQASSLLATEIAFESEAEYSAWVAKMLATVGKIADRILSIKPAVDDKFFIEAISLKGQVLCYQASLDSAVLPNLKKYADALAKNQRVQSLEDGRNATLAFTGVYLQAVVADIAEKGGSEKELIAAMSEVNTFVKEHPETSDMTVDLVFPVAVIAANLDAPKLPSQIWTPIRKTLAAAKTPEAENALMMLEGTIRYSELVGNAFEWHGCDAKGKPLDESLVKGRVVVVDFWASWCEQSVETHKQLAELYKTYHQQGFEIVSYNLDAELKDMDAFLQKYQLPWIVLSDRATVDAKETSLAAYYGISEIPTLILVGGDGNVASTDINLESLAATLQSVFPKTGVPAAAAGASAAPKASAAGAASAPATGATKAPAAGAAKAPATGATKAPAANAAGKRAASRPIR